ncbi:MAG: UDP-N-acetylmuramoyl-L-alanine--D-glutamate ligase [Pirellulales bacterium]
MDVRGRKITIMGLGRHGGGVAAARYLARLGAAVTVTDLATEGELARSLAALDGAPIAAFHLAGHREADFREADLVVVNPAVRPRSEFLAVARRHGVPITTEIGLVLARCPAKIIGITGSNGKSTTAAMTAAILRADGRRGWLGGNIGGSLLDELDSIRADDWVVLELSSFQLHRLSPAARMPEVAVVTNCAPNHLDWHADYREYVAAKQRILTGQTCEGLAILNTDDPEARTWVPLVRGRRVAPVPIEELAPLAAPGAHNRANAALAAAAALAIGCSRAAVERGLASFAGLPHRMEYVGQFGGRRFYNDSKATTPEATLAALAALDRPPWLLAGGYDKKIDLDPLAAAIVRQTRGAAFYGQVREQLSAGVMRHRPEFPHIETETLAEALAWCVASSHEGDCILLSPASASLDQFGDFAQRGAKFVQMVRAMKGQ